MDDYHMGRITLEPRINRFNDTARQIRSNFKSISTMLKNTRGNFWLRLKYNTNFLQLRQSHLITNQVQELVL